MCSVDLNMGIVSGTTHIKMIFTFLLGTGKHFIGKAPRSSYDSVIRLIRVLFFSMIVMSYKPPEEEIQRSQIQRMRRSGNGSPSSCPMIMKLPVQKGMNTMGEVRCCTI